MLLWEEVHSCRQFSTIRARLPTIRILNSLLLSIDLEVRIKSSNWAWSENNRLLNMKRILAIGIDSKLPILVSKELISEELTDLQTPLSELLTKMGHKVDNYRWTKKNSSRLSIINRFTRKRTLHMDSILLSRGSHTWRKCKKWVKYQALDPT